MTTQKIFDAHHHLWDLAHCRYPWLTARGVKRFFGDPTPIQKNYLVNDFLNDACEHDLVGSTHIQVGVDEEDAVKETQWLQSLSTESPNLPSAIVAFADLTRPDIDAVLNAQLAYRSVCGIRQIIGRHPVEDSQTKTGALLANPAFKTGLKKLSKRGLSFDLQLIEHQYDDALRLFETLPELKIAICHFASPWNLSAEGFKRWRDAMKNFASLPNTNLKFSGFGMFKPDWNTDDIKPYVETGLELFGDRRCMAGSNFPVDKLYGRYGRIWRAINALVSDPNSREMVTLTNAQDFYRVKLADA